MGRDLLDLIEAFELETELCVTGIDLTHVQVGGRTRPSTIAADPIIII